MSNKAQNPSISISHYLAIESRWIFPDGRSVPTAPVAKVLRASKNPTSPAKKGKPGSLGATLAFSFHLKWAIQMDEIASEMGTKRLGKSKGLSSGYPEDSHQPLHPKRIGTFAASNRSIQVPFLIGEGWAST